MVRRAPRDASTYLGAMQVSVRLVPVQDSFGSSTAKWCRFGGSTLLLRIIIAFAFLPSFASLSLLLVMSINSSVFLFRLRGHRPPPTLHDRLNPHPCLQRCRFPVPRYARRPDVALNAIDPLFLFPTPSYPHCTLKVSEHDSLWQLPATHSGERLRQ